MCSDFAYLTPMKLIGYEKLFHEDQQVLPEEFMHMQLDDSTYQDGYDRFKAVVEECIANKVYLPVYRMADGEFIFCLNLWNSLLNRVKSFIRNRNHNFFTIWGEQYSSNEIEVIKGNYIKFLKRISQKGLLAIHFVKKRKMLHEFDKYYNPMCKWFEENGIELSKNNYISFYYVYALITGKDSIPLFKNRSVLIITFLEEKMKNEYSTYFINHLSVKSIQFHNISKEKSMLDVIDFSKIEREVDIVLVAAGVGSANILCQCDILQAVCIDVGMALSVLIDKSQNKKRLFLFNDAI